MKRPFYLSDMTCPLIALDALSIDHLRSGEPIMLALPPGEQSVALFYTPDSRWLESLDEPMGIRAFKNKLHDHRSDPERTE